MLKTMKNKRATALGGLGIALFLCVLMALMPLAGVVENTSDEKIDLVEENNSSTDDVFALPDQYRPVAYDAFDPAQELVGLRSLNSKAYLDDEGQTHVVTTAEPVHYLEDGTWAEIDLNIASTADGWEVKKNLVEVKFSEDPHFGVSVDVPDDNVDPIVTGINPRVTMLDETGKQISDYKAVESESGTSIGGNTLRYHLLDGFDLDYSVSAGMVKQDLIIRERPTADMLGDAAWFGLTEELILPPGYALYLGDEMIDFDQLIQTQSELTIRNVITGDELASIPEPVVTQAPILASDSAEPDVSQEDYLATYFVRYVDGVLVISTMVEVDWLLSDERVFPISLDPSLTTSTTTHGYCRATYNYCGKRNTANSYTRWRVASSVYSRYIPFTTLDLPAIPSTATISQISLSAKLQYAYYGGSWTYSAPVDLVLMQDCGSSGTIGLGATLSCTNSLIDSSFSGTYGYGVCGGGMSCARSTYGSDTVASKNWINLGSGTIVSGNVCATITACATGTGASLTAAYLAGNTVGSGFHADVMKSGAWPNMEVRQSYGSNYVSPSITVVYSAGADTAAPELLSAVYDGVTSYVEGARTLFATFSDDTGIDTTVGNGPTLIYTTDGWATQSSVEADYIGSCTTQKCHVKAQTSALVAGTDVEYYWSAKDTVSTPNSGNTPTYTFSVADVLNAPTTDRKIQIFTEGVNSDDGYSHSTFYDRQLTYWEGASNEYLHEWDTSDCGTGNAACFDTAGGGSGTYAAPQWRVMWQAAPNAATTTSWQSTSQETRHHTADGGFLAIDETHGPSMNLLYWYNSTDDAWVVTGIGSATTDIADPLGAGTIVSVGTGSSGPAQTVYNTMSHLIPVPTTFTDAAFGEFTLEQTGTSYQSTKANWICVNSHGWTYFFRSTSASPNCEAGYTDTTRKWSGFSLGMREDQDSSSTYATSYDVTKIRPEPDTFEPTVEHSPMTDSHSKSRTFKFTITENGNPASGLDIGTQAGAQPTLYYNITAPGVTPPAALTWAEQLLAPAGGNPSDCVVKTCDWTYDLENLERGSTVTYKAIARDISTANTSTPTGANSISTPVVSFEVGDPNKIFIVEWHDMGASRTVSCTFQALFYDVTNEIEFKYSDDCAGRMSGSNPYSYYNKAIAGYQDDTRTAGATLRDSTTSWDGSNPHLNNFRISTGANGAHSWETFERGIDELVDYDTQLLGTGNGNPSSYNCAQASLWNSNKAGCNVNMDMPDNFYFNYFGTEYNGSDNDSRVHISRFGNMYFRADGVQALENSFDYSWGNSMTQMPNAGNSYSKPGNIAPYWHRYVSNNCYDDASNDCSIRTRLIPFEGKGTDVTETQWNHMNFTMQDSPVRIDPSAGDYLSFQEGISVAPGVVFQIANGKGISIDGACASVDIIGNDLAWDDDGNGSVVFEGMNGQEWLGMAFTGHCTSTETRDDRHQLSFVDFKNTSMSAISAGSRHGNHAAGQPFSSANVGNFSMDHITFDNVAKAFSHGSGDGTVVSMSDFTISNAAESCLDFARNSVVTLVEGTMNICNLDQLADGGAIVSTMNTGSDAGSLTVENLTVTNALENLIDVDFAAVWLQNVSASLSANSNGYALNSEGRGPVGGDVSWCAPLASCTYVNNLEVTGSSYLDGVRVTSATSYSLNDITLISGDVMYDYAGLGAVATKYNAIISDIVTTGDISIKGGSVPISMTNVDVDDIIFTGDASSTNTLQGTDWDASGEIRIDSACGWNIEVSTFTASRMHFSCSQVGSKNRVTVADGTVSHISTGVSGSPGISSAFYAKNTVLTVGETHVTSATIGNVAGEVVAFTSSNADVRLIAVDLTIDSDGDGQLEPMSACTGPADCLVYHVSSANVWYGGLATVTVTKATATGPVTKADHFVQANYYDAATFAEVAIGLTKTNATGVADNVWVISADKNGDAVNLNSVHVWGAGGVNDTLPTDGWYPGCLDTTPQDDLCDDISTAKYTVGDTLTVVLKPLPVSLNGTDMSCADLGAHEVAGLAGDGLDPYAYDLGETFTFEAEVVMETNVTLDGCDVIIKNQWKIAGSSAFVPVLTIGTGSTFTSTNEDLVLGNLMSATTLYPGLVVVQGTLVLDNGKMSNIGYGSSGAAIDLGDGASMIVKSSSIILGAAASSSESIITIGKGSLFDLDDSTINANGGMGLLFNEKATQADANNFSISNAKVGISSVNGEPQVWDYTLNNGDVGISVVNNPPPPPPPPLCVLGGTPWNPAYGGWRGPLSCQVTLLAGESMDISIETDYWAYYETILTVTEPDGTSNTVGPYYFASNSNIAYGTYSNPGVYTLILDDTYGDGGSRMTAALASDGGDDTEDPDVCDLGGSAYNPSFTSLVCEFSLAPNRAFDMTLQTYSWAGEAYVIVELSTDGGSTYSTVQSWGTYSFSNNQFYELGTFSAAGDYKITLGDSWGDGGQKLIATLQPAGTMIASFNSGTITGAEETAITVGGTAGEATVGSITNVDITSPALATGFLVNGWTNAFAVDGLNISGGSNGIDTGFTSSGTISFDNVDISDTEDAAVFYENDMEATVSGIIGSNTGAALKFGQYTAADVSFTGLTLNANGIGLEAQGSGDITIIDSVFTNTVDVEITSSSNVVFVDGTVGNVNVIDQIIVSDSGLFERARGLDYTLTADTDGTGASAVEEVNVVMLDENNALASSAETDSNGLAELIFNVYLVDNNGKTDMDLSRYDVSGVAAIEYTNTVADFRYINENSLVLTDTASNVKTYEMTENIDYRVCSTSTTTYESNVVDCNNWGYSDYVRTSLVQRSYDNTNVGGSFTEVDWNNGIGRSTNNIDWSDSAVMLDAYRVYMEDGTNLDLTGSEVFVTGGYTFSAYRTQLFTASYPYDAGITLDNTNVTTMATDDIGRLGWELGQAHVVDIDIKDSIINGIGGIVASAYPSGPSSTWFPEVSIVDSTLVHFEPNNEVSGSTSFYSSDTCIWTGAKDSVITGNTLVGCPAGIMFNVYYFGSIANPGADNTLVEDNKFVDTGGLDIWFTYGAYADDVIIRDNNFTGSVESMYGVYAQSALSTGMIIDQNIFWSAKEAIYMRGSLGWEITDNIIHGGGDSSYAGIYELNGYGEISGNTLIDADGGILIDGVSTPPPSKDMRCSIGQYSYSTFSSCSATLFAGETLSVRLKTDSWTYYEGSLTIEKPDGTVDSWSRYTLASNQNYDPFIQYDSAADPALAGTYTISVSDSYGDGGQMIEAYVALGGAGGGLVITDNDITTSSTRGAVPSAVGIWIENCIGSATVTSSRNTISILENALVTDGCDITDIDSTFTATGGNASSIYTVDINADEFVPQNMTIQEGDSIRWRAMAYYDSDGDGVGDEPHDVTSAGTGPAGAWSSGGTLNLGSSFVKTFVDYGLENYSCSVHPSMTGTITVVNSTGNALASTGINIVGSTDDVVLDGTNVGGFGFGVEIDGGTLHLTGDAIITASDNAVKATDATITSDGASLFAGTSSGTALLAEGTTTVDLVDLSVSGFRGVDTDNPFTWNGGSSDATTTLYTSASGKIENMSWAGSTNMIHAKDYARILSVANNLEASQLIVEPSAVIDEGNLFNLNVTHLGDAYPPVGSTGDVGLIIKSTDNARSEYASDAFNTGFMGIDGSMDDWKGEFALSPHDDRAPGLMSGTSTAGLYVTYDLFNLYIAVTGVNFDTAGELQIYFDSRISGEGQANSGISNPVAHNLPFNADFAFVGDTSNYEMKLPHTLLGWSKDASCTSVNARMGDAIVDVTEISIPLTCLDPDNSELRILAIVQGSADVSQVYPAQTIVNDGTGEDFSSPITIVQETDDLEDGTSLRNHVLIYQSYVGSNTASDAKQYDVQVKVNNVDCEQDWADITGIDMDQTIVWKETDILRACPEFADLPSSMTVAEDSAVNVIDLGTKAVDAQDDVQGVILDWDVVKTANSPDQLLTWTTTGLNGLNMEITLQPDKHSESTWGGPYLFDFTVTDSHGLYVTRQVTYNVADVNDKPIISPLPSGSDMANNVVPVFKSISSTDAAGVTTTFDNFATEGNGSFTFALGDSATNGSTNALGGLQGLIHDMFRDDMSFESNQEYSWQVDVGSDCPALSAMVSATGGLTVTEAVGNEYGGYCDLTLNLTDGFDYADEVVVTFGVVPVNDAPEILDWDPANGVAIYDGNGEINSASDNAGAAPWKISLVEDDESVENLTFNLSAMKFDLDHSPEETYWKVTESSACDYDDLFTLNTDANGILVGDILTLDLIKDATTTANAYEIDYFQDADHDGVPDSGVHQKTLGWCPMIVTLYDSENIPVGYNNYDPAIMPPAKYEQGSASKTLEVRIVNVPENVPDYYFDVTKGFDFHGVDYIIPKSFIPTTVVIGALGDAPDADGNYNYEHMLEICMTSNGLPESETQACDIVSPPEWGETKEYTKDIMISRATTEFRVTMDVLTCVEWNQSVGSFCDSSESKDNRFWSYSYPQAHRCVSTIGAVDGEWSCPGSSPTGVLTNENGSAITNGVSLENKRSAMLEDSLWCNNVMSSSALAEDCNQKNVILPELEDKFLASGNSLPVVVNLIASASVPSFAPSIFVISAAGMFVSALVLSSRREDDEAELEETLVDDEGAVSPVIATILMVAITVVLSGVIYVWASSLADTSTGGKGVPRFTFDSNADKAMDLSDAHYSFYVQSSETPLATQAMYVTVFYTDATGGTTIVAYSLADPTVYGFGPTNSNSLVTFGDAPETDTGSVISTFNTGDMFYVKTTTEDGYDFSADDFSIQLSYVPGGQGDQGAVLRVWDY